MRCVERVYAADRAVALASCHDAAARITLLASTRGGKNTIWSRTWHVHGSCRRKRGCTADARLGARKVPRAGSCGIACGSGQESLACPAWRRRIKPERQTHDSVVQGLFAPLPLLNLV